MFSFELNTISWKHVTDGGPADGPNYLLTSRKLERGANMSKAKTLPANNAKESLFETFKKIVLEAVFDLAKQDKVESSTIVSHNKMYKIILEVNNENLEAVNNTAWDLRDLAVANGNIELFGTQLFEGQTKSLFDFIVFDL